MLHSGNWTEYMKFFTSLLPSQGITNNHNWLINFSWILSSLALDQRFYSQRSTETESSLAPRYRYSTTGPVQGRSKATKSAISS